MGCYESGCAMSLYDRMLETYASQSRRQIGNFPLPLRRKKRKGEQLDPNQFTEQSPTRVPGSGWLRTPYPAGTKYAGKVDAVVSGREAKKVADALRWMFGKRVVQLGRYPLKTIGEQRRESPGLTFKQMKKHQVRLDPEESKLCHDRKAVWNFMFGRDGKRKKTAAVWKSVLPNGETWYSTNTHRAWNTTRTLKGTIKRFHDFIRGTA